MRRLIWNIKVEKANVGDCIADSNFSLLELSIQAQQETHLWAGRIIYKLRQVDENLKIFWKQALLVDAAEAPQNLTFLV